MERKSEKKRAFSRRDFLKGVPLGLAGGFVLSSLTGKLFPSGSRARSKPPEFPEGSIFTPAKDRTEV